MKIVVAVRCLNEVKNIDRFMKGYDFADQIVVSDGGSTDGSLELLGRYSKIQLLNFGAGETIDGHFWNGDADHMNFVLGAAKKLEPDWLIFDDMDCCPNHLLRDGARAVLEGSPRPQVNVFRLYLWGDDQYFPHMNRDFDPAYRSLWAWKPSEIDIHADTAVRHGTLRGQISDPFGVDVPMCLLHKSWHPATIDTKIEHYNKIGLPMEHPFKFAGPLQALPEWARE